MGRRAGARPCRGRILGGRAQCDDVCPCLGGGFLELGQERITGGAILRTTQTLSLLGELGQAPGAHGACRAFEGVCRRYPLLVRLRLLQGIDGGRRLPDEKPQDLMLEPGIPERVATQMLEIDRTGNLRGGLRVCPCLAAAVRM